MIVVTKCKQCNVIFTLSFKPQRCLWCMANKTLEVVASSPPSTIISNTVAPSFIFKEVEEVVVDSTVSPPPPMKPRVLSKQMMNLLRKRV